MYESECFTPVLFLVGRRYVIGSLDIGFALIFRIYDFTKLLVHRMLLSSKKVSMSKGAIIVLYRCLDLLSSLGLSGGVSSLLFDILYCSISFLCIGG